MHSPDGRILRANRAFADASHCEPVAARGQARVATCSAQATPTGRVAPIARASPEKPRKSTRRSAAIFLPPTPLCTVPKADRLGTIHVLKDFTSRRLAENKFRNLFEKAQEGVFIATPEGRFVDFNDAFMRILGYENRED